MTNWLKAFALGLALCLCQLAWSQAAIPAAGHRVTDTTTTLSAVQTEQLAQQLQAVEQRTGAVMQVLIIDSLRGEPIEDYSQRVFDAWKPGHVSKNDGVLLVLAREDRRMRIHVGRGLEGAIPDLAAKQVTSTKMVPAFKAGNFYAGFSDAVAALEARVSAEAASAAVHPDVPVTALAAQPEHAGPSVFIVLAAIGLPLLAFGAYAVKSGRKARREREERQAAVRLYQVREAEARQAAQARRREQQAAEQAAAERNWEKEALLQQARLRAYAAEARTAMAVAGSPRPVAAPVSSSWSATRSSQPAASARTVRTGTSQTTRRSVSSVRSTSRTDDDSSQSYAYGYAAASSRRDDDRSSSSSATSYSSNTSSTDSFGGDSSGGGASDSY